MPISPTQVIPRVHALQNAARFSTIERSYQAKYPGEAGQAVRALAEEVLARLAAKNAQPREMPHRASDDTEAAPVRR